MGQGYAPEQFRCSGRLPSKGKLLKVCGRRLWIKIWRHFNNNLQKVNKNSERMRFEVSFVPNLKSVASFWAEKPRVQNYFHMSRFLVRASIRSALCDVGGRALSYERASKFQARALSCRGPRAPDHDKKWLVGQGYAPEQFRCSGRLASKGKLLKV